MVENPYSLEWDKDRPAAWSPLGDADIMWNASLPGLKRSPNIYPDAASTASTPRSGSGHNAAALAEYVPQLNSRLQEKYQDRRIYVSACDGGLVPQEQAREAGVDIIADHAGYWETSIIMATHPHLVHMDRVAGKDPDSLCVTNNDVLNASAEMGHKIIELCGFFMGTHMKKLLSEVVVEVPIPEPMPEATL